MPARMPSKAPIISFWSFAVSETVLPLIEAALSLLLVFECIDGIDQPFKIFIHGDDG